MELYVSNFIILPSASLYISLKKYFYTNLQITSSVIHIILDLPEFFKYAFLSIAYDLKYNPPASILAGGRRLVVLVSSGPITVAADTARIIVTRSITGGAFTPTWWADSGVSDVYHKLQINKALSMCIIYHI